MRSLGRTRAIFRQNEFPKTLPKLGPNFWPVFFPQLPTRPSQPQPYSDPNPPTVCQERGGSRAKRTEIFRGMRVNYLDPPPLGDLSGPPTPAEVHIVPCCLVYISRYHFLRNFPTISRGFLQILRKFSPKDLGCPPPPGLGHSILFCVFCRESVCVGQSFIESFFSDFGVY